MSLTAIQSQRLKVIALSFYDLGHQPLSLAAAAAILKSYNCDFSLIDLSNSQLNKENIRAADIILLSVPMHTAARMATSILPELKNLNSNAHISAFGLYAIQLEDALSEKLLDSVFVGEFEPSLKLLIEDHLDKYTGGQQSLIWDKPKTDFSRQNFLVPERTSLPDLDVYAKVIHYDSEKLTGYIETSRGCAHVCSHCPVTAVYKGKFRIIDEQSILLDVDNLINQGAEHITFGDPDFFNAPKHSLKIASLIKAKYPKITFDATIKVEHILEYKNLIKSLDELGFIYIISAFESTSDIVLKNLKKNHNLYDMHHVIEICKNANLFIKPTWIPFTPWMLNSDYASMINFIIENELVELTPRIQYGIKLLIPKYSALLEDDSLDSFDIKYSSDALNHEWEHVDRSIEKLYSMVSELILSSMSHKSPKGQFFQNLCSLVEVITHEKISSCTKVSTTRLGSTENWYCCAEPTDQQLITLDSLP